MSPKGASKSAKVLRTLDSSEVRTPLTHASAPVYGSEVAEGFYSGSEEGYDTSNGSSGRFEDSNGMSGGREQLGSTPLASTTSVDAATDTTAATTDPSVTLLSHDDTTVSDAAQRGNLARTTRYMYFCTLFDTLGGLVFGFDTGIIGGVIAMPSFRTAFGWPVKVPGMDDPPSVDLELGLVVALLSAGCFAGAVIGGPVADYAGRRPATILGAALATGGGAMLTAANERWELLAGRVVAGLGIGSLSVTVPLYNAEISPSSIRGRLVAFHQLSITFGIMLAFCVNIPTEDVTYGWRISLGLQCLFSALLLFGAPFLPETPRWLVAHNKKARAAQVLRRLRGVDDVTFEMGQIEATVAESKARGPVGCRDLGSRALRKRLTLGMGIMILSQLTGINTVMYYAPIIFSNIGMSPLTTNAAVGIINFLSTFVALYLLDRSGRRPLLLWGAVGMFVSMLVAASALVGTASSSGGGGGGGGDEAPPAVIGYVVAVFVCLYTAFFAATWGPSGWVLVSEIFPLRVRGKALGVSSAANWLINTGLTLATPLMLNSTTGLGTGGTFFLLASFLGVCTLFVTLAVPETKEKTLEEIEDIFAPGRGWLDISGVRNTCRGCCRCRGGAAALGGSYTRLEA
eukprot:UC1_evm1s664